MKRKSKLTIAIRPRADVGMERRCDLTELHERSEGQASLNTRDHGAPGDVGYVSSGAELKRTAALQGNPPQKGCGATLSPARARAFPNIPFGSDAKRPQSFRVLRS
jgi:hypothetical protein